MDYQSHYLINNPSLHIEDAEIKFNEIASIIPTNRKYDSILDVGCGAGVLTVKLSDYLHATHTTGLDISQEMIKNAKIINKNKNITWIATNISTFNPTKKFDLVICADIIEHIDNDIAFINKMAELGQEIIIRTPLENSLINHLFKKIKISDEFKKTEERYGHVHHYSLDEFINKIHLSGLKILNYRIVTINKKRTWWFNEIFRIISLIIAPFSIKTAVNFSGGFLLVRIVTQ